MRPESPLEKMLQAAVPLSCCAAAACRLLVLVLVLVLVLELELELLLELHGVGEAGEVEVTHLQRRHDYGATGLGAREAHGTADRLEVVEHEQRRIVEAEILHSLADLAVLDEERAVAREAGVENRARIHFTQVPQPRDEDAAFRRLDHVLDAR